MIVEIYCVEFQIKEGLHVFQDSKYCGTGVALLFHNHVLYCFYLNHLIVECVVWAKCSLRFQSFI